VGRRRFLAVAASGGAVVLGGGLGFALLRDGDGGSPDPTGAPPAPPSSTAATRAVGERYLAAVPEESDPAELRRLLPAGIDGLPPATATAEIAAAVRSDFAEGRTVEVDGWLLSATECRLAALSVVT
jgi:hypothetical protein